MRTQGFTLIELMIVVAIIAILAAAAVPNFLSSKIAANESAAVATLRTLSAAQAQFQAAAPVDVDVDGVGEFGTFGELSGLTPLNARGAGNPAPLDPPILSNLFQNVDAQGRVTRSGYSYQMWLPSVAGQGVAEVGGGGPGAVDADFCEMFWSCYAWPVSANRTGARAFFVNHRGSILQTRMEQTVYDAALAPNWDAALDVTLGNNTMGARVAANGLLNATDNNTWVLVE